MAEQILELRTHLRTAALSFPHQPGDIAPTALEDDPACRFIREAIVRITAERMRRLPSQLRADHPAQGTARTVRGAQKVRARRRA